MDGDANLWFSHYLWALFDVDCIWNTCMWPKIDRKLLKWCPTWRSTQDFPPSTLFALSEWEEHLRLCTGKKQSCSNSKTLAGAMASWFLSSRSLPGIGWSRLSVLSVWNQRHRAHNCRPIWPQKWGCQVLLPGAAQLPDAGAGRGRRPRWLPGHERPGQHEEGRESSTLT